MDLNVQISEEIEQYEKKIYDQKQLIHISKALNSNLNLNNLIESILNISLAQSQTFQIGIYLNPEVANNDFFLHENFIGFESNNDIRYVIPYKHPLVSFLATAKKLYTLGELRSEEEMQGSEDIITQFESLSSELLLIPLINKGKINGLMVLGPKTSQEEYSASEKNFLADLASIASIAVENARLYELATVDMMTHLKIHHYFKTRLIEEMEVAKESGRPLSLYMTDIDHFKQFNDTYGHQLGDVVLKAVAEKLIRSSRSTDVPSRYGGEEFAVILPNTNLGEAKKLAERTRAAVEEMQVENATDTGDRTLKVCISAGVAQYNPRGDQDVKMFIERCDKALYKAKHNGRNRVEIAN